MPGDANEDIHTQQIMKTPPKFNTERPLERYVEEVKAWAEITSIPKASQGTLLMLNMPETGKYGDLKGKIMDSVEFKGNEGLKKILAFLEDTIGDDEITITVDKISAFMDLKRTPDQTVREFVTEFESAYTVAQSKAKLTNLPPQYLMCAIIKNSNISDHDRKLVLSGIDLSKPETIYKETKKALIKYCGDILHT